MFDHELPEYMPSSVGVGGKTKVTIRTVPQNVTALFQKDRADTGEFERTRDRWFLATLLATYGGSVFPRGNLDAGRLNRLFGREIVPATTHEFDPVSLVAQLRISVDSALTFLRAACDHS
jgi:hypothetical protein